MGGEGGCGGVTWCNCRVLRRGVTAHLGANTERGTDRKGGKQQKTDRKNGSAYSIRSIMSLQNKYPFNNLKNSSPRSIIHVFLE